jgi:hypothetical protein
MILSKLIHDSITWKKVEITFYTAYFFFYFFGRLPKVNYRPIGENSPFMVTQN